MSKICYAVEIDTGSVLSSAIYALTFGYLRFITDRPNYTGTETGDASLPVGENSVLKIDISGSESFGVAMASGQLYGSGNPPFKTASTVMNVGDRFTVLDNSDFTGGTMATAKGSAPAEGDMFEIIDNDWTPRLKYVGVNRWFEDFITRDGMSNPSRSVDLVGSGDYGTLSGFTFEVKDTIVAGTDTPFWKYIATNNINLANRPVKVYAVIDDIFYQIWQGVIESNTRTETGFTFVCANNFKATHKDIPLEVNMAGDAIPVCIGDVEYAKILNSSDPPAWLSLTKNDGVEYNSAQALLYDDSTGTLILYTKDIVFVENALTDKYLFVLDGGNKQEDKNTTTGTIAKPDKTTGIKIISNTATISNQTSIILSEPILDEDGMVFDYTIYGYSGVLPESFPSLQWSFGIANFNIIGRISDGVVTNLKTDSHGFPQLYNYISSLKEYRPVNKIIESTTLNDSGYGDGTTIKYFCPEIGTNKDITYQHRIPFTIKYFCVDAIDLKYISGGLVDVDRETYLQLYFNGSGTLQTITVLMDISLDNVLLLEDVEKIFIGIDYDLNTDHSTNMSVNFKDCYGKLFSNKALDIFWPDSRGAVAGIGSNIIQNPTFADGSYWGFSGSVTFASNKAILNKAPFTNEYSRTAPSNLYQYVSALVSTQYRLGFIISGGPVNVTIQDSNFNGSVVSVLACKTFYASVSWQYLDFVTGPEYAGRETIIIFTVDAWADSTTLRSIDNTILYSMPTYLGKSMIPFNMLPNDYYKLTEGANSESSLFGKNIGYSFGYVKKAIEIPSEYIAAIKTGQISNDIQITITFTTYDSGVESVKFKEIGVFGSSKFTIDNEGLYSRVSGEKTTGAAESNTVYNAFRLLLETYDVISANNIDYGNLPAVRHNLPGAMWHVGRQLTERKNNVDYIKELCENSFVAAFQNRKGKLALSAWRDRTDTAHVHDNTSIIKDSIGEWELTSIDQVFNSFTVNYSYDPGGDKYFSAYQIKDVDSATYPTGGGIQHLWDICHAAYSIYNSVKEFQIDLPWFNDRARWYNEGEAGEGLGADGSAYKWLLNAVYWMTRQKRNVGYNIPMTGGTDGTLLNTELCDPVDFRDPIYTNSLIDTAYIVGAIQSIEYDLKSDSIRIGSILNPDDTIDIDYGDAIETGSATDTMEETGSATDTETEDGN